MLFMWAMLLVYPNSAFSQDYIHKGVTVTEQNKTLDEQDIPKDIRQKVFNHCFDRLFNDLIRSRPYQNQLQSYRIDVKQLEPMDSRIGLTLSPHNLLQANQVVLPPVKTATFLKTYLSNEEDTVVFSMPIEYGTIFFYPGSDSNSLYCRPMQTENVFKTGAQREIDVTRYIGKNVNTTADVTFHSVEQSGYVFMDTDKFDVEIEKIRSRKSGFRLVDQIVHFVEIQDMHGWTGWFEPTNKFCKVEGPDIQHLTLNDDSSCGPDKDWIVRKHIQQIYGIYSNFKPATFYREEIHFSIEDERIWVINDERKEFLN